MVHRYAEEKGLVVKDMLKCCLNWKVIAGIAVVGLGLWTLAPGLLSAALPLLVLAICPLSMLVMMKAMNGQQGRSTSGDEPRPVSPAHAQATAPADSAGRAQA